MSVFYDLVSEQELEDAHKIEARGYPEDEAGSLETFRYRQSQAPELFLGAYLPQAETGGRKLIGYVCATLSPESTLTHESMSTHVPGSPSVCIHSVCVDQEYRQKYIGLNLVKEFVSRVERAAREGASYDRILLIAHEELRGFYEKAGFEWVGRSAVEHGVRPWYEMRRDLRPLHVENAASTSKSSAQQLQPAQDPSENQSLPPGLWEALQRSSTRSRPVSRLLTSFPNAVQDVVMDISKDGAGGSLTNKYDLLCPRPGCGSIILKSDVATWVERESVQLDPAGQTLPGCLGALPAPPATAQWWLVKPNAMAFENIGFSRAIQATGPTGRKLKLLACAECDLGPLGWCEEGGSEFWLACNRVGYRA
ncbi:acyl-CoA N-acyltransferase [Trametes sanguinea]|nr:acyl-CoA N-acyltransferase [Trametes sanguinea]